jgi:MFS family permease
MSQSETGDGPPPRTPVALRPWSSLRHRDFRLLLGSSLFIAAGQQMRQTANFYQVYALSGSPFQLGLTGLFQAVPLLVLGIFGGTVADLVDRKKLIVLGVILNLLLAVTLGILTLTETIRVWHILVATAVTASINIVLNPARMAMIPRLVPRSHLMNAVSLNSSTGQASQFIGPLLAGLSIAWLGMASAYFFNALLYVPAAIAVLSLRTSGAPQVRERASVKALAGGVQHIWRQRVIIALFLLDFGVISVGYFRPLLPVFARNIYEVGPAGFGLLAASPAIGAVLGAATLLMVGNVRRKGPLVLWAVLLYSLCLALFSVTPWFWLALIFLAGLGFTNALNAITRQTSVQILTPDHLRGRVFGIFTIFGQGANSLGTMEAGFVASRLGAPRSMLLGGGIGAAITLAFWGGWPILRRFRAGAEPEDAEDRFA